jgi:hypothetical protein
LIVFLSLDQNNPQLCATKIRTAGWNVVNYYREPIQRTEK